LETAVYIIILVFRQVTSAGLLDGHPSMEGN